MPDSQSSLKSALQQRLFLGVWSALANKIPLAPMALSEQQIKNAKPAA
jgi:hypothetical protein